MITIDQLFQPEAAAGTTLGRPLEHLMACHRRIEDRLATLERVVPFLQSRESEALEAIGSSVRFLDSNGVLHTADEEESLFPRLRSKASEEETALFDRLEADHEAAEAVYAELKAVAVELGNEPADAAGLVQQFSDLVGRLCAIYRRHIREEDTLLIPIARRLLSEQELAEIAAEMKSRRGHAA